MNHNLVIWAIGLGAVVTWVPRVFPFILVKYRELPNIVVRFLNYLPLTIIFALMLSSFFHLEVGQAPTLKWIDTLASIPTLLVAFRYKNLLWTVIVGIVSMALIRFIV